MWKSILRKARKTLMGLVDAVLVRQRLLEDAWSLEAQPGKSAAVFPFAAVLSLAYDL